MRATKIALVSVSLLASSLAAQEPRTGPGAFSIGGGIELLAVRDNQTWTPGLSLQASYWFTQAANRLRFRLTTTYVHHTNDLAYTNEFEAFGLSGELTATVSRTGRGLYGIAGIGLFRLRLDDYATAMAGALPQPRATRNTSGAMVGGIGYSQRLGSLTWFAETRFHAFSNGHGIAWAQMPLTVGLRF